MINLPIKWLFFQNRFLKVQEKSWFFHVSQYLMHWMVHLCGLSVLCFLRWWSLLTCSISYSTASQHLRAWLIELAFPRQWLLDCITSHARFIQFNFIELAMRQEPPDSLVGSNSTEQKVIKNVAIWTKIQKVYEKRSFLELLNGFM